MKKIPLSKNKVALVDDEDSEWLSNWKWHVAYRDPYPSYAKTNGLLMHRLILGLGPPSIDLREADHVNGDGLDNRRVNLRICSRRENCWNRTHRKGRSGFIGVSWQRQVQRWQARLRIDGVQRSLGMFDDPLEAARVYDAAVRKHRGPFGRVNGV